MEETIYYGQQQEMMYRTEAQALTLARLQGLRALHDAFPDAEIFARREECTVQEDALHYHAVYTVAGRYLHIAALKTHTKKPNICKKQVFSFFTIFASIKPLFGVRPPRKRS